MTVNPGGDAPSCSCSHHRDSPLCQFLIKLTLLDWVWRWSCFFDVHGWQAHLDRFATRGLPLVGANARFESRESLLESDRATFHVVPVCNTNVTFGEILKYSMKDVTILL